MQIVGVEDHLILSEEGASNLGPCYSRQFYLSEFSLNATYGHNASDALFFNHYNTYTELPVFFHGHTILNWAMFSKPRHSVLFHVLKNIVEIVKSLYLGLPSVHLGRNDYRWKMLFCSTTFTLTYTIQQLAMQNASDFQPPRIESNNFAKYGGKVKAISTKGDDSHYTKVCKLFQCQSYV